MGMGLMNPQLNPQQMQGRGASQVKPQYALNPQQLHGGGNIVQPKMQPKANKPIANTMQRSVPQVKPQQAFGLADPNIVDNQPNSDYNIFGGSSMNAVNVPTGGKDPFATNYDMKGLADTSSSNMFQNTNNAFNTDGINTSPQVQYNPDATQQAGTGAPEMSAYQEGMLANQKRRIAIAEASQMTGFERGLQNTSNVVGMASSLGNAYLANKNYELANKTYNNNKAMANRNLANQAKMVNADIMNRNSVGLALGGAAMTSGQRAAATATARSNRVDGSAI